MIANHHYRPGLVGPKPAAVTRAPGERTLVTARRSES